jgi:hypothetical protein
MKLSGDLFINGIGMQSEPSFNVINGIGGMS